MDSFNVRMLANFSTGSLYSTTSQFWYCLQWIESSYLFDFTGCVPRQATTMISRRGSSTSTVSSFYSSMCSDVSPQTSTGSEASRSLTTNSSCDPIATGCSRRTNDAINNLSTHFRRVHIPTLSNTGNLVVQPQNMAMTSSMMLPPPSQNMEVLHEHEDSSSMQSQPAQGSPGSQGTQVSNPTQENSVPPGTTPSRAVPLKYFDDHHHPNERAALNCGTDQPVEELDDLVLPDELINYLAQGERPASAMSQAVSSVSQYDEIRNKNYAGVQPSGSTSNGHSCYSNSSFAKAVPRQDVGGTQKGAAHSVNSQPKSCNSGTYRQQDTPHPLTNQAFYSPSQEITQPCSQPVQTSSWYRPQQRDVLPGHVSQQSSHHVAAHHVHHHGNEVHNTQSYGFQSTENLVISQQPYTAPIPPPQQQALHPTYHQEPLKYCNRTQFLHSSNSNFRIQNQPQQQSHSCNSNLSCNHGNPISNCCHQPHIAQMQSQNCHHHPVHQTNIHPPQQVGSFPQPCVPLSAYQQNQCQQPVSYCQCGAGSCRGAPHQPPLEPMHRPCRMQANASQGGPAAYRTTPNNLIQMPQPNLVVLPQQACHQQGQPMALPLAPSPAPISQTPSIQSGVATYGTSHSSSCQGTCLHRSQSNHCCAQPAVKSNCTERSSQYAHAAHSYSGHKCSRCSNCSKPQPEIQCRSVSQSSRAAMPPDTYKRTLEYVQQCQQLVNNIGPPGQDTQAVHHPLQSSGEMIVPMEPAPVMPSVSLQPSVTSASAQAGMVLSPGCNKVTSTTDKSDMSQSRVDGIDSLKDRQCAGPPKSPPNKSPGKKPAVLARTVSAKECRPHPHSPLLCTNNMVINDMSATLTSLMQETKCLQLLQ